MSEFEIRSVTDNDIEELFVMIRELAVFEKLEDQLVTTPQRLRTVLLEQDGGPEGLIAESDGKLVGYALFFENFSSFLCRRGIYLEDVYVRPEARGHGVGKAFLRRLAEIAVERECGRMEWVVLDWNTNAIEFYQSLGAKILDDWRIVRMDRQGIETLASASNTV
ncbi:MAG: GNAT family N-acetyltransferase [Planctomycetota bacterium]